MEDKTYKTKSGERNRKDSKLAKIAGKIAVGATVVGALSLGGCYKNDSRCFDFNGYINGERIMGWEYASGEKYQLEVRGPNEIVRYSNYNDDFVLDEVITWTKTKSTNFLGGPIWQTVEYKADNIKHKEDMEKRQKEFKKYLKIIVYNKFALNPDFSRICGERLP